MNVRGTNLRANGLGISSTSEVLPSSGAGYSVETFHLMSTGQVAAITTTDTFGYLIYSAGDIVVDALATEIETLGAGAGTDLTLGIYDAATGALLAKTADVAPVIGLNVVALQSTVSLARGQQYYFAIYCARAGTNFCRRSPNVVPSPGAWDSKVFGWTAAAQRLPASMAAYLATEDTNPVWIAARSQAITPVQQAALITTEVAATPTAIAAPATGQETVVLVDTVTIGAPSEIDLPASPSPNSRITIKDQTGSAGSGNAITIEGSGVLIDGSTSALIDSDYASLTLHYNGAAWGVI